MEIVQHIQTTEVSIVVTQSHQNQFDVKWEEVMDKYVVPMLLLEHLVKAIGNCAKEEKASLLIHTYPGIALSKELQKALQDHELYKCTSSIAIILPSTALRISLNLFSQLQNIPVPIKAFSNEAQAQNWLNKQAQSLKKK